MNKWMYFSPHPFEKSDNQGHTISLLMATESGFHFSIEGSGFNPFETVTIINSRSNFSFSEHVIADRQGRLLCGVSWDDDLEGTDAILEVQGQTTELQLEYQLGKSFKKYDF